MKNTEKHTENTKKVVKIPKTMFKIIQKAHPELSNLDPKRLFYSEGNYEILVVSDAEYFETEVRSEL